MRLLRRERAATAVAAAVLVASLVLSSCTATPGSDSPSTPTGTPTASAVRDVALGLEVPWDLAVLPDGDILVTLRDLAEVVRVDRDGNKQVIGRIDEVAPAGEGDSSGRLYASEFGQDTFDELNLIQAGGNYGWPQAEGFSQQPDLVSPLLVWRPVEASPSGIAVSRSGTVYIAALRGQRVWTTSPSGAGMTQPRVFLDGLGRIRVVEIVGQDLFVLTNNTARGTPRSGDDRLVAVPLG